MKTTFCILILLSLFIFEASAQNLQIEFQAKPGMSYSYTKSKVKASNVKEKPIIICDYEIDIGYQITEKYTLGTGFNYTSKGKKLKMELSDNPYSLETFSMTSKLIYNYLEFPFYFKYSRLGNRAISNFVIGITYDKLHAVKILPLSFPDSVFGMTGSEFARQSSYMYTGKTLENYGLRKNNFGIRLAYGKEYKIESTTYFGWNLHFNTLLAPVLKQSTTKEYFFSFGLNFFFRI